VHGINHPPHLAPRLNRSRAILLFPLWTFTALYSKLYIYLTIIVAKDTVLQLKACTAILFSAFIIILGFS
jgi:hypothetical protein